MKRLLSPAFAMALVLTVPFGARAQNATPVAGGCTVEPMAQTRIDELAAQAATPAGAATTIPADLSQGQPIGDDLRAELMILIRQNEVCAQLQDLPRLLSLYTDRFIVEQFFAHEPVQIVETTNGTPASGPIPPTATDQEDMLMAAVLLPDGRVAANVSTNAWGGGQRLFIFVQQDGVWKIDQINATAGNIPVGGSSEVTIPADAQGIVDLVLQDAAAELGVEPSALTVSAIEAADWPGASLGCPEEGGVYAQIVSPGYRILVTDGVATLEYHTGLNDAFVNCLNMGA
jgi:hypothetical protein